VEYGIVEGRPVPEGKNILRDEVILLCSQQEVGPEARLRRVEVWVEEKKENMVFLTNNFRLAASTVSAIHKERWQIEQFFKALKQSMKIKTFVGTTENAVQTQI
jgi:IS4 transposase